MDTLKDMSGRRMAGNVLQTKNRDTGDKIVALAGNPNVGKSTVFNELTGMNQHTGNWAGKTVSGAWGECVHNNMKYIMVDIPGTYSLLTHSREEEIARDFICFGDPDAVVVVCDATCLERNLNLVLQTMEITPNVLVCVNLLDEAKRKKITIDFDKLSKILGVNVVGISARTKEGMDELMDKLGETVINVPNRQPLKIDYGEEIEHSIDIVTKSFDEIRIGTVSRRWIALRLIENDSSIISSLDAYLGYNILHTYEVSGSIKKARDYLEQKKIDKQHLHDRLVETIVRKAETICNDTVSVIREDYNRMDRKIDRILTGKLGGIPIMIGLLMVVFWITIIGANYPSQLLSGGLFYIEEKMLGFFRTTSVAPWIYEMLVLGVYRVLAWVVSVMLPPMAIFFPMFTLLEDLGYLPRVAFNLDKYFKKANACGKQALTMCMGFGCNAAGVVGCRIIDSPRERLIAMITNSFVPCNGRFPTLIVIITMFFVGSYAPILQSTISALMLTAVILLGVLMTFFASKLLSKTLLKGVPSSFTLELPPYRRPQFLRILVRSLIDRTIFVLGRAISVAAPAGLIIWVMANVTVGGISILTHCSQVLDPFARLIGLDGVILIAFILGFPANEIVIPIIIMAYMSTGYIMEFDSIQGLRDLLISNGWTPITAISVMLFSLMHWPCSTTCITIGRETKSIKWTIISFIIPAIIGIVVCFIFANTARLFI